MTQQFQRPMDTKGKPRIEIRMPHFFASPENSEAKIPRYWFGGRKAVTRFFDSLSILFPAGERFFVAAVKKNEHFVKDAALLEAVRGFCGQEGIHTREHVNYNDMLKAEEPAIIAMEKRVERLLRRVKHNLSHRQWLAATAALEHFTAMLAHMLLEDSDTMPGAHPAMDALWKWHAAEENEHKAVAFDVYAAAHGPYVERAAVMLLATLVFWAKVFEQQVRLMHADGALFDATEWKDLGSFLFVDPAPLRRMLPLWALYFRPHFHPDDLDASALVDAWKESFDATWGAASA